MLSKIANRKSLVTLATLAGAALLMLLAAGAQAANTLNVPSQQYPTIQSAIDAAGSNDTIRVAPGTYAESLSWLAKDITILGAGADKTFIDPSPAAGGPGGRCLYTWELGSGAHIGGFTFQHGNAGDGGGMFNTSGSCPTITNCIFRDNSVTGNGGGMYNYYFSDPTVINCTFQNCHADVGLGGGMNNWNSSPTLTNCTFSGNTAFSGGGMYNTGSSAIITNCAFSGNAATYTGGMWNYAYSSPTITNCTFSGNTADYTGAMANNYNSSPTVTNCILWGNAATNGDTPGGIASWDNSSPIVTFTDLQDLSNTTPDADHNFAADPLFVRNPSPGADTTFGTADDDFGDLHLTTGSPCIDAGNNTVVTSPPFLTVGGVITDLDGTVRIASTAVDLGPYEFGSVAAVTDTTAPTLTWGTATPAPNAAGWNNTPVDLPFTTADNSGVAPSASVSSPLHFGAEGAGQTQTVTVTDQAGNHADFTSPAVNIDLTAPTTTGSATGTTTSTVTLTASDSLSGVQATYYRVDGGAPQTYAAPFTLPQGHYTVQYGSVDKADNPEAARYLDVDTRFAVTVTVASASGKRGGKVTLSATVTQSGTKAKLSGKAVTFTVDGVFAGNAYTSKQGVASLSWTIPTSFATGQHTIAAVAQPDGTYQPGYATGTLTVNR